MIFNVDMVIQFIMKTVIISKYVVIIVMGIIIVVIHEISFKMKELLSYYYIIS